MTIEAPAVPRESSQACKVTADGEVIVAGDLVARQPVAINSHHNFLAGRGHKGPPS